MLERGFKAPEFDDEGQEVEDAEILEEKEDFDRQKHEVEMLSEVLKEVKDTFINGNFYDIEEDVLSTPLLTLL